MKERFARSLELVAMGAWVGALIGFAFIFAPIAFRTIPDLNVFAGLIADVLTALGRFGYACGGLALVAIALGSGGWAPRLRALAVAAMIGLIAYETQGVVPTMVGALTAIRTPLSTLAPTDPRRTAYDAEHRRSSEIYGLALLLGVATMVAAGASSSPGTSRSGLNAG